MVHIRNIKDSIKKGGGYGIISASFQVSNLLWLRTINSYQNKYGNNFISTFKILYNEGGFIRFYRCYFPALSVASFCKVSELSSYYFINNYDISSFEKNSFIACSSCITRIIVLPLDSLDTAIQVYGKNGYSILKNKVKNYGIKSLYNGGGLWITNKFIYYYIWFSIFEKLNSYDFYKYQDNMFMFNLKNSFIGFTCSAIGNSVVNPIRVLKINKQVNKNSLSYYKIYNSLKSQNSQWYLRGLQSRIIMSGLNNAVFMVIWKNIEKYVS